MLSLQELRTRDVRFTGINPVRQKTPDGNFWSGYIQTPRPNNGLVYVCSDVTLIYEREQMQPLHLTKGHVLFAPKGSRYKVISRNPTPRDGADSYTVNFNVLDQTGAELELDQPLAVIARDQFSRFHPLVAELTRSCYDIRPSQLKIQANFQMFLDAVLESMEENSREYYIIRRGVEQLKIDWNRQEKMEKYARLCGISQCYFNATFRHWAGISPVEYRNRLRIAQAQSILRTELSSISETSALVGYEDPFYFSRVFKSIAGVSPQEYKRRFSG